jgi:hypothetical protein
VRKEGVGDVDEAEEICVELGFHLGGAIEKFIYPCGEG